MNLRISMLIPLLLLHPVLACGQTEPDVENAPAIDLEVGMTSESPLTERAPWSSETLDAIAHWPLQHGGRVKPFDTYAGFTMLKINGKRILRVGDEKLGPVAWALDCMIYPEIARGYECIQVTNAQVLTNAGIDVSDRKRSSRWSFEELLPFLDQIFRSAGQITETKESSNWELVERQTVQLAQNVRSLEELFHAFDSARHTFPLDTIPELRVIYGESQGRTGFSSIIMGVDGLEQLATRESILQLPPERQTEVVNALQELQSHLLQQIQIARMGIAWFAPEPPEDAPEEGQDVLPVVWGRADTIVEDALLKKPVALRAEALQQMEAMVAAREINRGTFHSQAAMVRDSLTALASHHGQYNTIAMEVSFYKMDYFYHALICFLLAFVIACIGWLRPASILPTRGTWGLNLLGITLLVTGVTLRCIIQGRPPVTTLYETILFITGCCVISALFIERYDRRKIALTMAALLGSFGCFLSIKYELKEAITAGDTMPSLVAVLDTNFWLSTHVTSVTLGYSAGLLAAAIAHVWLLGKLFGIRKDDKDFYRSITRMVYGTICFGLFFSLVGTILGGIWANYSWGRFWGWDPKENGALLICLAELIILHARMSGLVREHGLHILAVINGMIVAFSWWGVNLLGVGLHSYGFTDGVLRLLLLFFSIEAGVVLISLIHRGFQKHLYRRGSSGSAAST